MTRTQLYIPDEQRRALQALSHARATSVAEIVRLAIADYLARAQSDDWAQVLKETSGAMPQWEDGELYERRMRAAWDERSAARMRGE